MADEIRVQLLYFARLREVFGRADESLSLPVPAEGALRVADVLAHLAARGEPWAGELAAGRSFRVACNQDMAELATPLRSGDELAIFPPVTGG